MPKYLQSTRDRAFQQQGGLCHYCSLPMWQTGDVGPGPMRCTAEHLTARCSGGNNRASNIVAAHAFCNGRRHRRKRPPEPAAFRREVLRRVERGAWLPPPLLQWARLRLGSGLDPGRLRIGSFGSMQHTARSGNSQRGGFRGELESCLAS